MVGKKPNVSYFKVFGAPCWIRDPHHQSKFTAKACEGFMLGYGINSHTYRVYNINHHKIVEIVDMRFDESDGLQREHLPPDLDEAPPKEHPNPNANDPDNDPDPEAPETPEAPEAPEADANESERSEDDAPQYHPP